MRRLLALLLLLLAAPLAAQEFPALSGRVVDAANILPPDIEAQISARSEAVEKQTGAQLVVATVPSLDGLEIEDYGYRLGRHWGIGQKRQSSANGPASGDNGVILLVAPNERRVRIEVGYGLEPTLTDALSNQIIQNDILPPFREGGYARGIEAGVDAVIAQLKLDAEEARARAAEVAPSEAEAPILPGIIIALIFVFFFLALLGGLGSRGGRRGRKRRGIDPVLIWGASEILSSAARSSSRSGSSWGGSSGGFRGGGGSFGGGGASGGW